MFFPGRQFLYLRVGRSDGAPSGAIGSLLEIEGRGEKFLAWVMHLSPQLPEGTLVKLRALHHADEKGRIVPEFTGRFQEVVEGAPINATTFRIVYVEPDG